MQQSDETRIYNANIRTNGIINDGGSGYSSSTNWLDRSNLFYGSWLSPYSKSRFIFQVSTNVT